MWTSVTVYGWRWRWSQEKNDDSDDSCFNHNHHYHHYHHIIIITPPTPADDGIIGHNMRTVWVCQRILYISTFKQHCITSAPRTAPWSSPVHFSVSAAQQYSCAECYASLGLDHSGGAVKGEASQPSYPHHRQPLPVRAHPHLSVCLHAAVANNRKSRSLQLNAGGQAGLTDWLTDWRASLLLTCLSVLSVSLSCCCILTLTLTPHSACVLSCPSLLPIGEWAWGGVQ